MSDAPRPKTPQEIQMERHRQVVDYFKEKLRKEEMKKREPRSKLNEWAKFIVSQGNFMFTVLGFTITGMATYMLLADFGDLDKGFFLGGGIIFFLFGWIVLGISYLGCQGIYYQRRVSPYTKWQGTRILSFYQIFLIVTVVAEIIWLAASMDAITSLRANAASVLDGETPVYSSLEVEFALKFNAFFFGAQSECGTLRYAWFWSFVNKRCSKYNSNMSQLMCMRCSQHSVTMCDADPYICYNSEMGSAANFACPYNACREGVLEFVIDRISPFAYFTIFVVVFQVLLIFSTCTLICFHPRDTDAEIRAKNGIFAKDGTSRNGSLALQGQQQQQQQQQMMMMMKAGGRQPVAPVSRGRPVTQQPMVQGQGSMGNFAGAQRGMPPRPPPRGIPPAPPAPPSARSKSPKAPKSSRHGAPRPSRRDR